MIVLHVFGNWVATLLAAFYACCLTIGSVNCESTPAAYLKVNDAYLCIYSDYVNQLENVRTNFRCANQCNRDPRCQAFSTYDGPCQLFVFDRCSKNVRICSCSRRGQVFVKQQVGLELGALCPPGYGDNLCGVKYKMYADNWAWWSGRRKCENESGLVIMADVIDSEEMNHVNTMYTKYNPHNLWLGGYQLPGSPEPDGGWYWVGCNITVDSSLWALGEPNNDIMIEDIIIRSFQNNQLNDGVDSMAKYSWDATLIKYIADTVLCECLSPFN